MNVRSPATSGNVSGASIVIGLFVSGSIRAASFRSIGVTEIGSGLRITYVSDRASTSRSSTIRVSRSASTTMSWTRPSRS